MLLSDLCALMRDVLVLSVAPKGGRELLSGAYDDATLKKFARSFTKAELLRAMERVQEAIVSLRDNPSPRTAVELCLVSLCDLTLCDGLPELRARVSRLEAGAANAPRPRRRRSRKMRPRRRKSRPRQRSRRRPRGRATSRRRRKRRSGRPSRTSRPRSGAMRTPARPHGRRRKKSPRSGRRRPLSALRRPRSLHTRRRPRRRRRMAAPRLGMYRRKRERASPPSGPCWDDVVSHLKGRVPVGYWNLLTDPLQVRGEFTDAGLHVAIAKGFAANMLTKPDMMDKFRAAAAEIMGHGVPVNVTEMDSDEKIATRSIEELRRFKEVKFT